MIEKKYLETLKKRAKKSNVYKKYQYTGLKIATILNDSKNKSFYMKLAKYNNEQDLMNIAEISVEKKTITNPGAYFTKIAKERGFIDKMPKNKPKKKLIKKVDKQQKITFKKNRNGNKKRK